MPPCYIEVHHVYPKSMGGSNEKTNLAVLTAKEHFICHLLLTKMYPNSGELIQAFMIMCNRTPNKNAENYKLNKEVHSQFMKDMREKIWTPEKREQFRIRGNELKNDPKYIKKVSDGVRKAYATTNLRQKISNSSKENWKNPEYRKKVIKANKESWTEERRKKHSDTIKEQNKKNPEIKKKRMDALKDHMYTKSPEWIEQTSKRLKEYSNSPEGKAKLRARYRGSNFDNSRKVVDKETKLVYNSLKQASEKLGINYNTLKKYFYNNNPKCPVVGYKKEEK